MMEETWGGNKHGAKVMDMAWNGGHGGVMAWAWTCMPMAGTHGIWGGAYMVAWAEGCGWPGY